MDVLNLANNHSGDFGVTALLDTHPLGQAVRNAPGGSWAQPCARTPRR